MTELDQLRAQLAEAQADIERLKADVAGSEAAKIVWFEDCMRTEQQLAATRTALAAAEARETQLCKAIVLFRNEKAVGRAGSVRATEGYAAMQYAVFDQPRDDSALREMIAGVYEECVQACKQFQGPHRAMTFNDELERCVYAIRALAEKAKGE